MGVVGSCTNGIFARTREDRVKEGKELMLLMLHVVGISLHSQDDRLIRLWLR